MNNSFSFEKILKHEKLLHLGALLLPVLLLFSMLIQPLYTTLYGEVVTIQTTPYDPTDLFRGDYVDLFYDINQIDTSIQTVKELPTVKEDNDVNNWRGKPFYIVFKPGKELTEVDYYSFKKPASNLYLKGKVVYAYKKMTDQKDPPPVPSSISQPASTALMIQADFGIDRYFIEENTGAPFDEAARNGNVQVTLKIKNGYGMVQALKIVPKK